MGIVNQESLSITLDNLNEAFFYDKSISQTDKEEVAKWLASRQGLPGSYWGMFAPTDYDINVETRLFTGEKLNSRASARHILGEETCRALILLDVHDDEVSNALERASGVMIERLASYEGIY